MSHPPHERGATRPAAPAALGASHLAIAAWLALLVSGIVASVVQPQWPLQAVNALLWMGGAWRALAVPVALLMAGGALAANTTAPGVAWPATHRAAERGARWLPTLVAFTVGAFALGYESGLLTARSVAWAGALFAIQVALFPGTPTVALLAAATAAVLALDARRERALDWAVERWRRRPRALERWTAAAWPVAAVWLGGAAVAAVVFPAAMQGWGRPEGPDAQRYNFYTSFFNFAENTERVVERTGYELGGCGLTLGPGQRGSITFQLDRTPDSLVFLKANFYNRPTPCAAEPGGPTQAQLDQTFPNRLELSIDQGHSYRPVLVDATVGETAGDQVQDLSPLLGDARSYLLRFSAANTVDTRVTVLPSFVISAVLDAQAAPHPLFPVVPYLGAAAVLAYSLGRATALVRRDAALAGIAVAALAACAAAGAGSLQGPAATDVAAAALPLAVVRGAVALLVAGLAAVAGVLRSRRARADDPARLEGPPAFRIPWLAAACLLVALVAVDARWDQLIRVRYEFLLPDAQGYRAIAAEFPQKMAHYRAQNYSALLDTVYAAGFDGRASGPAVFYAGGNNGREPLWPATERVVFDVLGVSAFHARLTSLLLGVLGAALTCWFGWRALHPLAGLTAGLLAATNRPLVVNSVAGLREELVSVLFLVGVVALFVSARRRVVPSWSRVVLAGVAMGGVVLDRADMVVLAGGMTTLAALALRWPVRRWLAACAIIGALAGPMYIGYAFTHHDPFYPGTYGATVNRNLEFPERMGTPGFPTPEEYAANWAAGPTISPLQYFFGYHTVRQFVDYSLRGFWRIFTDVLFVDRQKPALWLFVAGMLLLVVTRRWLIPFLVVAALMPFYAFLAGVPNPWVFAPRYAHHAFPYAAMAAAYAAWFIPLWLGKKWTALTPWQER